MKNLIYFEREEAAIGKPTTWNDYDDYRDIEVSLYTDSIWTVKVYDLESDTINIIHLCYVGELWSFLSICGVVLTKKNYNETKQETKENPTAQNETPIC